MRRKCPKARLLAHARGEDECWLWPGADSGNGYGRISVDGKTRATHIVAYELFTGTRVPPGMVLDHQCRNRHCYNPRHLKPIPGVVNTLIGEGPTAINALKTHCLRGHELAGDNLITRTRKGRRPSRECRACRTLRNKPMRLKRRDQEQIGIPEVRTHRNASPTALESRQGDRTLCQLGGLGVET